MSEKLKQPQESVVIPATPEGCFSSPEIVLGPVVNVREASWNRAMYPSLSLNHSLPSKPQPNGVVDVRVGSDKPTEVIVSPRFVSVGSEELSPGQIWMNTLLRSSYRFTVNSDQQQGLLGAFSQKTIAA